MNGTRLNPFRPTRWEHQGNGLQLIWFTDVAQQLAAEKSIYVQGSRGSGKTTLLKSICWEDLAQNESLRLQRRLADFDHIGVYIRFPDHLSAAVSQASWRDLYPSTTRPDLEFHRYFSLIVELTCAERALEACHNLRVLNEVRIAASQELRLVEELFAEFPAIGSQGVSRPRTYYEAARVLRNLVRQMNEAPGRGLTKNISESLPPREPGVLLDFVANRLSDAVQIPTPTGQKKPRFKFCLDDCEVLSSQQQKSVNTLVRTSRFPISWVVSSVGGIFDNTETYIDQQPLTDADRKVLSLDSRHDKDFRELCQAVASLRLLFASTNSKERSESTKIREFFSLQSRLGRRSVNDMMSVIASRSTARFAVRVIKAAHRLRAALEDESEENRVKRTYLAGSLPLFQTYLLLLWRGREEAFKTTFGPEDEARITSYASLFSEPSFEAWLRRKQRAALLHFGARLGFRRFPLAGDQVLVSLADGSIRDFLEILGEIFEAYSRHNKLDASSDASLHRFATVRTQIGWDIQTEGVYAASKAYFAGIGARSERGSDIILRLLEGLGHLTGRLQSNPDDPSVLGRAERGIFAVKFGRFDRTYKEEISPERELLVWSAIRRAELAGYIRTVELRFADSSDPDDPVEKRARLITFRLHRRLAPHFRFSYRGAYEVVGIRTADLWPLCDRTVPIEPASWAESLSSNTPSFDQLQLALTPQDAYADE